MFPNRMFPNRMFPQRMFCKVGAVAAAIDWFVGLVTQRTLTGAGM